MLLKLKMLAATSALAVTMLAAPAMAAETVVNFSLDAAQVPLVTGTFSYNSSKTGQLSYSDLDSFSLKLPANTYDLAFVNSGSFSDYRYFGYNASIGSFVSATISGFPEILSAIKDDGSRGFFVRKDSNYTIFSDYGAGNISVPYTNITVSSSVAAVPEPATWAMLILGMGAIGFAMRRRRNVTTNIKFA
jgi:hypothetical protein